MKERPILFSAPMVRAILEDRKTVTRRVVKPAKCRDSGAELAPCEIAGEVNVKRDFRLCPYGQPGDRLWVREAFADGLCTKSTLAYRATHKPSDLEEGWDEPIKWKPSIHMPRWVSRILLEITDVRVERLQDITDEQAEAEGIDFLRHVPDADETLTPAQLFECLWSGINGHESWNANPWVWCVSFKRIDQ